MRFRYFPIQHHACDVRRWCLFQHAYEEFMLSGFILAHRKRQCEAVAFASRLCPNGTRNRCEQQTPLPSFIELYCITNSHTYIQRYLFLCYPMEYWQVATLILYTCLAAAKSQLRPVNAASGKVEKRGDFPPNNGHFASTTVLPLTSDRPVYEDGIARARGDAAGRSLSHRHSVATSAFNHKEERSPDGSYQYE